jgi:hypothetical protein
MENQFYALVKNYWVEEKTVRKYNRSLALKIIGNSTFKQWTLTEAKQFL